MIRYFKFRKIFKKPLWFIKLSVYRSQHKEFFKKFDGWLFCAFWVIYITSFTTITKVNPLWFRFLMNITYAALGCFNVFMFAYKKGKQDESNSDFNIPPRYLMPSGSSGRVVFSQQLGHAIHVQEEIPQNT